MNYPPMVMRFKVERKDRRVNLWLPLFILAPIAVILGLAVFVIVLPFILLAMILTWRWYLWRPVVFFWPLTLGTLIALRGLEVDVKGNRETVLVSFK